MDKEQHWHTMHSHAHCHNGQCTPRHVYQVWNMPLTTTLQRGGGSSNNNNNTTDLHWTQHSLDSIDDQLRSDCSSIDSDCIWSACARCVPLACQVAPIQVRVKLNSQHMYWIALDCIGLHCIQATALHGCGGIPIVDCLLMHWC